MSKKRKKHKKQQCSKPILIKREDFYQKKQAKQEHPKIALEKQEQPKKKTKKQRTKQSQIKKQHECEQGPIKDQQKKKQQKEFVGALMIRTGLKAKHLSEVMGVPEEIVNMWSNAEIPISCLGQAWMEAVHAILDTIENRRFHGKEFVFEISEHGSGGISRYVYLTEHQVLRRFGLAKLIRAVHIPNEPENASKRTKSTFTERMMKIS